MGHDELADELMFMDFIQSLSWKMSDFKLNP